MLKLTRDQLSVIELALEELNPDKLTAWQLDNYATGTDKSDYIDAILFEVDELKVKL